MNLRVMPDRELFLRLLRDDRGAEVLEYALVMGMIALISIGPMQAVGQKLVNYWRALDNALGR